MNEELLKLAYQSLKRQFDNISKDSWIWTDFFEDEKVGFDYFKKQIEQDEDFACLQIFRPSSPESHISRMIRSG